ncbi:hypothetical protein AgCh_029210 [Apium graveolens]
MAMDSFTKPQGVPVSAAQASPRASLLSSSSGSSSFPIRAPLTVDSDSDASGYGSDNGGYLSDEVKFDNVVEKPVVVSLNDEISGDEVVSKPFVTNPSAVISEESVDSGVAENRVVSKPFMTTPSAGISEESVGSGVVENRVVSKPFVTTPSAGISEESVGSGNVENRVVSKPFVTTPSAGISEESVGSGIMENRVVSKPFVTSPSAGISEESVGSVIVGNGVVSEPFVTTPSAEISKESVGSGIVENRVVSKPFVTTPSAEINEESVGISNVERKIVSKSYVTSPNEKVSEGKESSSGSSSSVEKKVFSGLNVSIPDRIITMKRVVSRRFLAVNGESLASPLIDDEGGKNVGGEALSVASPGILSIATTPLVKEENGKVVGGDKEFVVSRPFATHPNEKISKEKESSSSGSNSSDIVERKAVSVPYLSISDNKITLNRVVSRRSLAVNGESLVSPLVPEENGKDVGKTKLVDDIILSSPSTSITPVAKLSEDSDEDSVGNGFEEDVLETLEKLSTLKGQVFGVGDGDIDEDELQFNSVLESEVLKGLVPSKHLNAFLGGDEGMSIVESDSLKNDNLGDLVKDEGSHIGGDAKATSVVESEVSLISGSSTMDEIADYSVEEIDGLENMEQVAELYHTDSMDKGHIAFAVCTSTTKGGTAIDSFKGKGVEGGQTEDDGIDESNSAKYFPIDTSHLETYKVVDSTDFVDLTELGTDVVKRVEDENVSETQGEEDYVEGLKLGESNRLENIPCEMELELTSHPKSINEHFVTCLDEDVGLAEESGKEVLLDSTSFSGLPDVARSSETVNSVAITFSDDSGLLPLENSVDLDSSISSAKLTSQSDHLIVSTLGEMDQKKILAEEEINKLDVQQIKAKYLRLVRRLGLSTENSVAAQVLYLLDLAKGKSSRPGFSQETAKMETIEFEANDKKDLDISLNILIIGKSGVGKSATINSIFGEEKIITDPFEPARTFVKEIVGTVDGIKLRVLDTPGLGTSLKDQSLNKKILKSIQRFMNNYPPDVVIYVDRLDMLSQDHSDLPLLRSITRSLGSSLWHKTIITLTHAASTPPDGPSEEPIDYEKYVALRSHVIQKLISHAIGEQNMINEDAVNPVCLVENQGWWKKSRNEQVLLPNGEAWKPQLLLLCYSVKILSELKSTIKAYKTLNVNTPFDFLVPSPPLPRSLSVLLQSCDQLKFSADQCKVEATFWKGSVLVGRNTELMMCAGLNKKSEVSVRISSSEQLHMPLAILLSIVRSIFSKILC